MLLFLAFFRLSRHRAKGNDRLSQPRDLAINLFTFPLKPDQILPAAIKRAR
jgi:hypothetical protein